MKLYNFVKKNNISKTLFITYFTVFTLIFYFIFCIIFGQKGLIEYFSLKEKIYEQNAKKQDLENELEAKKNKVSSMNSESLDLDLLDEEARKNLGFSTKNEIIIYHQKDKNDKK